jgi:hypothetical protein
MGGRLGNEYGRDEQGVPYFNLARRKGWHLRQLDGGGVQWIYRAEEELDCPCFRRDPRHGTVYACSSAIAPILVVNGSWATAKDASEVEGSAVWALIRKVREEEVTCNECGKRCSIQPRT